MYFIRSRPPANMENNLQLCVCVRVCVCMNEYAFELLVEWEPSNARNRLFHIYVVRIKCVHEMYAAVTCCCYMYLLVVVVACTTYNRCDIFT